MLDILADVTVLPAIKPAIDPEAARLLLCQRVVIIFCLHSHAQCFAIRPAQMIALSAAAIIGERLSAKTVTQMHELLCNLSNSYIPGDGFKTAVWCAPQRCSEAV